MLTYILIILILIVAELLYFKLADRFNIIDKPNHRSSHTKVTIRGGGVVFFIGVLLFFLMFGFHYPWFMLGLALIAGVSFADDIRPQSRLVRLGVQVAAMLLVFYELNLLEEPWYFTLVALVFFVGVINAYNFMDGINGITGGYSLVVVGSLWFINAYQVPFVEERLLYVLLLAILVFNWFNFRAKARCFAGDVGAVSMAFILVFLLGLLILKTNNLSYILLLALYGVDTILTIIHRLMLKENIFLPHRKHLFQLMANELKIPHVVVSLVYMLLQALVSMGLIMTKYKYEFAATMVVLFVGIYVLFMRKYYALHKG